MKLNRWLVLLRLLVLIAVLCAGGMITPSNARPLDSKIALSVDDDDDKDEDDDDEEEDDDDKDDDDDEEDDD